jgi:hypothetical protein
VYIDTLFTTRPADLSLYPFLYPPMTLPIFGVLSALPRLVVEIAWVAGSLAAAVATLRLFGVRWTFVPLLLLWPPFFQGLQVGNVAVPLGVLFAIAPSIGAGLVVAAVFKVYSGLAALWLVRERRVRELVAGIVIVVAAAILTLPLTGVQPWADWWRALDLYRQSQPLLADYLYGFGLPRYLPTAAVLAITSVAPGLGWWPAIAIGITGWFVAALRRPSGDPGAERIAADDAGFHPLGANGVMWPGAPVSRPRPGRRSRAAPVPVSDSPDD